MVIKLQAAIAPESTEPVPGPAEGEMQPITLKVPPIPKHPAKIPLFNREYSWIEFNRRVLAEAQSDRVPLLERLKFLSICSTNLDEFLMVRVGGLRDLIDAGFAQRSADGRTPRQQLDGIRQRTRKLLREMYRCFDDELLPALEREKIRIQSPAELSKKRQDALREHFEQHIAPVLTPLAFDPGHPFPWLSNLSLNLALVLDSPRGDEHLVMLKIPALVPRLIRLDDSGRFIPIETLIAEHAGQLFPGLTVRRATPFRVIRNADFVIKEDEIQQDLLHSIETELRRRDRQEVVAIEVFENADESLLSLLSNALPVSRDDVFPVPSFLRLGDLMQIYNEVQQPELRDPPFNPRLPVALASSEDIFSIIRREDVLLHRPYDSFSAVVEFVQAAAEDPDVVAIKQTLYRSDAGSPIVGALEEAARRGKQVAVVVELQARFDEMKNITWARRLEQAGVEVVYGLVGIKTHSKLCLVIRREGERLRQYLHLSTGNYNAITARIYSDIDLFTTDEEMGHDAVQLMNLLTGFSLASIQEIFEGQVPELQWKKMLVAPMDYHRWVLDRIDDEIAAANEGKPARIVAKFNALVDPTVIDRLYHASQAGVSIDLVVRGICCLVPGVEGISDNIRVMSIIDRFLEHVRIFHFENGRGGRVWVSSGDWMPRNFFRRVELTFPVLSPALESRLREQILAVSLEDRASSWDLTPTGDYHRRDEGNRSGLRSQRRFIELVREEAARLVPYEEAILKPARSRRKAKRQKKKGKRN